MKNKFLAGAFVFCFALGSPVFAGENSYKNCFEDLEFVIFRSHSPKSLAKIFFKRKSPHPSPDRRLLGLLTEYSPSPKKGHIVGRAVGTLFQGIPRKVSELIYGKKFNFTPFQGLIWANLAEVGPRLLTQKTTGVEYDLRAWFGVPIALSGVVFAGYWGYEAFDWGADAVTMSHIANSIEEKKEDWLELIKRDFRYQDIRVELENKKIDPTQASQEAYARKLILEKYYSLRSLEFSTLDPADQGAAFTAYLSEELFSDIAELSQKGLPATLSSYKKLNGFSGSLSHEQIKNLVEVRHSKLMVDEILSKLIFEDPEFLAELKVDEKLVKFVENIQGQKFYKDLFQLYVQGQISQSEFCFRAQEDNSWRHRFREMEVLKIEKRAKDNQNRLTQAPLTLEMIQNESLSEIQAQVKSK